MEATTQTGPVSKQALWTGRTLSTLVILFMAFDAFGKFMKPQPVVDAMNKLGLSLDLAAVLGVLIVVCTVLYAVPRTAVLGAILMTGYFGGAVSIHLRAGSSLFEMIFPVIFGILAWLGLWLQSVRLRGLIPLS